MFEVNLGRILFGVFMQSAEANLNKVILFMSTNVNGS